MRATGQTTGPPELTSGGGPVASAMSVARGRMIVAAGALVLLGVAWYDRGLGLFLLVAVFVAYLLHALIVYLADAGLLGPTLIVLACVAVGAWPFLPDRLDVRAELRAHAPAPVWRAMEPLLSRVLAGSDMVPAAVPSPGGRLAFGPAAARAGATAPASGVVRTTADARAPVTVQLTSSSSASAPGDSVIFTVVVQRATPGADGPPGRVDLLDGRSRIATAALATGKDRSKATFNVSSFAEGTHVLVVRYRGASGFRPATSDRLVHPVHPAR